MPHRPHAGHRAATKGGDRDVPDPRRPREARATLRIGDRSYDYYRLDAAGAPNLERLPYTVKILLENMLRGAATQPDLVTAADVRALATWDPTQPAEAELPFMPARVILQDFTGVPCVVDLAAMRDAMAEHGRRSVPDQPARAGRPRHRPLASRSTSSAPTPHSSSTSSASTSATASATRSCAGRSRRSRDFRVVPPGTGIVHQVNLEFLADVVTERDGVLLPDTLVGTDSHTTMINGLGVVGWGVGGIEAEAALLGQPLYQPMPIVVGFRLDGELPPGATATDLVLYVTEMLRAHGVVGQVRRVPRPRAVAPVARRPRHDQQHVARVRRDRDALPDRRRDAALPAHDRPARRGGRASRGVRAGPGPVPHR